MKTLKEAEKAAEKKAKEVRGFVIDCRALCILFVKKERKNSDEYITLKKIRYKLSVAEKAIRTLEDEKKAKKAKEITKGLSFLNF